MGFSFFWLDFKREAHTTAVSEDYCVNLDPLPISYPIRNPRQSPTKPFSSTCCHAGLKLSQQGRQFEPFSWPFPSLCSAMLQLPASTSRSVSQRHTRYRADVIRFGFVFWCALRARILSRYAVHCLGACAIMWLFICSGRRGEGGIALLHFWVRAYRNLCVHSERGALQPLLLSFLPLARHGLMCTDFLHSLSRWVCPPCLPKPQSRHAAPFPRPPRPPLRLGAG